jgi:methylglyoxal synthase
MKKTTLIPLHKDKKIALVAHDHLKADLVEWVKFNKILLSHHTIFATGTTGGLVEKELGRPVHKFQSGPLGGDQQIGSAIVTGEVDFLIFFWDPLAQAPHDPDVKALLRLAAVWNIPVACNRSTADFLISSPLMDEVYDRRVADFSEYQNRKI